MQEHRESASLFNKTKSSKTKCYPKNVKSEGFREYSHLKGVDDVHDVKM